MFPLFLYPLFCFSKYSSLLRFLFSDSLMMELYLIDPGGLSYPLLEHPALYMETLSQLLVRNTVPLTRFIWLEEKTFTQPWKHK